jgi:hypothetical protein
MPRRARSRASAPHSRDLWSRRREWPQPNQARLAELRRSMAVIERKRYQRELRAIQRRRRWMAGLIFGLLYGTEYCAALAAAPLVRQRLISIVREEGRHHGPMFVSTLQMAL